MFYLANHTCVCMQMSAWMTTCTRISMHVCTREHAAEPQDSVQQAAQKQPSPEPAKPLASVQATPKAEARGTKRALPDSPQSKHKEKTSKNTRESEKADTGDESDEEPPRVLLYKDMTKLEREKVRRICSPKKGSGKLEVPENVFQMWQDAAKGRESLFRMWCKSGGVKAGILMHRYAREKVVSKL